MYKSNFADDLSELKNIFKMEQKDVVSCFLSNKSSFLWDTLYDFKQDIFSDFSSILLATVSEQLITHIFEVNSEETNMVNTEQKTVES